MLAHLTRPYPIPYRIMIPESLDGLIVPVAASTTHVAYSSIRMEPTWMALGQAAGTAAHLCIENTTAYPAGLRADPPVAAGTDCRFRVSRLPCGESLAENDSRPPRPHSYNPTVIDKKLLAG
jgi:hypothetical protein